jgi:hypothetical protein
LHEQNKFIKNKFGAIRSKKWLKKKI